MPECELCGQFFKTPQGLQLHSLRVHKESQEEKPRGAQGPPRFQKFPCPSCRKEITEDRNYGDLQAFMCPYCYHLISHGGQEDMGAGGFQVYYLQGRAKNHLEATWLFLLERGWRPREFLLRNHPRLKELMEEVKIPQEEVAHEVASGSH